MTWHRQTSIYNKTKAIKLRNCANFNKSNKWWECRLNWRTQLGNLQVEIMFWGREIWKKTRRILSKLEVKTRYIRPIIISKQIQVRTIHFKLTAICFKMVKITILRARKPKTIIISKKIRSWTLRIEFLIKGNWKWPSSLATIKWRPNRVRFK